MTDNIFSGVTAPTPIPVKSGMDVSSLCKLCASVNTNYLLTYFVWFILFTVLMCSSVRIAYVVCFY